MGVSPDCKQNVARDKIKIQITILAAGVGLLPVPVTSKFSAAQPISTNVEL